MKIFIGFIVFNIAIVWSFAHVDHIIYNNYRNREFSGKIYKELAKDHLGNFVGSPMSLELILCLLFDGARSHTADQIAHALVLHHNRTSIDALIEPVIKELQNQPDVVTLDLVNKIYVTNDLRLANDFTNTALNVFHTDVATIDFRKPDHTMHVVNKWISEETDHHITDVLSESDVNSNTKAVLVNALNFKATWLKRFSKHHTKKANFFIDERHIVPVDMLETTENLMYYEDFNLRAKFLEIPYHGHSLSMVVVLPERKYGLPHLEKHINEVLHTELYSLNNVHVKIPKFKTESVIDYVPVLEELGVADLFTPSANLDGIAGVGSGLHVNKIIQKNSIGVHENGTVSDSAAVSDLASSTGSSYPQVEFVADHPFIYYVKSAVGVLFVGRYAGHE
ncbi:hypothetical protein RN001_010730 [Aquatica leii]|uniref:Serpin domain-containing protein n=1 Tax=Aquatica leii TaxID=1421715 RepID=A0AAN7PV65_9COLE|nr:hypothetical protein RN001_010730 [Aquatica leii]